MAVPYTYDELRGKVAVVTGGSQNLGAAMARALGDQGCKVAVIGRSNPAGAEAVAVEIRAAGSEAMARCADLRSEEAVERLFAEIVRELGPVDILVNNAGGWTRAAPFWELSLDEWRMILSDNLDTAFLCARAVARSMMERRWGRIINLSSVVGRIGVPNAAANYGASKGGIIALTRQQAAELGPHGITVNAIAPGTTPKPSGMKRPPEYYASLAQTLPLRRLGSAEDHAAAVCFLASDAASWITGITLDVAGGQVMT
ncbi:MAG: SDR family oxidoreductase [Chloroflexi bacterium]|nr:SDR family oxidoreductase [Chloroflexota bacterium]